MLPSEELRQYLSKKYNINLNKFAWKEELRNKILSTELDKDLEENANTLEDIYIQGFNIGHCGLTSRYIARRFNKAKLFYGNATLLKGTKNSPNGEHAWTTLGDYVIDSTLMIIFPISLMRELGYTPEKEIAHNSARILSEYDIFNIDYIEQKKKQSLTH